MLPPEAPEVLWTDPHRAEGKISALSQVADTFDHLSRYGPKAYPQRVARFGRQWAHTMSDDLPRLEGMHRFSELARTAR